ncbi:MAG: Smr/MutS family protein [Candidatus Nitrotoga sp.]
MSNKKQPVTPSAADAELFRQALGQVIPLPPANRANASAPPLQPTQHKPRTTDSAPPRNNLSDFGAENNLLTEFTRPGIARMELRKLRRGKIQDSLDLHGLTSDEAQKLLLQFLREAIANNLRYVCIIHGKGWHAEGGAGVLKTRSRHWLTQCSEVLAFCETQPHEGGSGAVKVLLKSNRENIAGY